MRLLHCTGPLLAAWVLACSDAGRDSPHVDTGIAGTASGATSESSATSDTSQTSTSTGNGADATTGSIKFDQGDPGDTGVAPGCDPDLIPDTTAFAFVASYELGIDTLQAGLYDSQRQHVVVFSFYGEGKILDLDGTILASIAAPPEALPSLDGGAYDAAADLILLVTQDCDLIEVDPETFAAVSVTPLGAAHAMSICAGIAIDPQSNLYIASFGTNELVVTDRAGAVELRRVDMLAIGLPGFDGIAEIAGSENFLVNSTSDLTAAVIAADGTLVAGPGAIGVSPIMGGGAVGQPDAMLTICDNGHTWVCDAYETTCSDFAPSDGDKIACGCLVAG